MACGKTRPCFPGFWDVASVFFESLILVSTHCLLVCLIEYFGCTLAYYGCWERSIRKGDAGSKSRGGHHQLFVMVKAQLGARALGCLELPEREGFRIRYYVSLEKK